MPIEIEKKYQLTRAQRDAIVERLPQIGSTHQADEFEENTLFKGGELEHGRSVLRLRRVGKKAVLTYKERQPSSSAVKRQREDETSVSDPDSLELILNALGFTAALVYEKRRSTWHLGNAEIVIDELPFGLFMEIEGSEEEIENVEQQLGIDQLNAEHATYPQLASRLGKRSGDLIESRFKK